MLDYAITRLRKSQFLGALYHGTASTAEIINRLGIQYFLPVSKRMGCSKELYLSPRQIQFICRFRTRIRGSQAAARASLGGNPSHAWRLRMHVQRELGWDNRCMESHPAYLKPRRQLIMEVAGGLVIYLRIILQCSSEQYWIECYRIGDAYGLSHNSPTDQ